MFISTCTGAFQATGVHQKGIAASEASTWTASSNQDIPSPRFQWQMALVQNLGVTCCILLQGSVLLLTLTSLFVTSCREVVGGAPFKSESSYVILPLVTQLQFPAPEESAIPSGFRGMYCLARAAHVWFSSK